MVKHVTFWTIHALGIYRIPSTPVCCYLRLGLSIPLSFSLMHSFIKYSSSLSLLSFSSLARGWLWLRVYPDMLFHHITGVRCAFCSRGSSIFQARYDSAAWLNSKAATGPGPSLQYVISVSIQPGAFFYSYSQFHLPSGVTWIEISLTKHRASRSLLTPCSSLLGFFCVWEAGKFQTKILMLHP